LSRLAGIFHPDQADVVGEFVVHGKVADGGQQFIEQLRGGPGQALFHVHNQPFLGVQFLVRSLHFVQSIREEHHQIARCNPDFTGLIGRVLEQAEGGLAFARDIDEWFDAAGLAVDQQRFGMAGVGKTHDTGTPVGDQVKRRGEHRRTGGFKDCKQVGIDLAQKHSRVAGDGL